jgi:hypothetical protein
MRRSKKSQRLARNPVQRISVGSTATQTIPGEPSWRLHEVHPIHETGQKRLFPLSDFREVEVDSAGRKQPSKVPSYRGRVRYYKDQEGDEYDPFVYGEEIPERSYERRYFKDIAHRLRTVVVFDRLSATIVQPPLTFKRGQLEKTEEALEALAERLKDEARALYDAESERDQTDYFSDVFEQYLSDGDQDIANRFSGRLGRAIDEALEVTTEEAVRDIVFNSARWSLEDGSDVYADWSDEYETEIEYDTRQQENNDTIQEIKKEVLALLETFVPGDDISIAWELWVHEVLPHDYKVFNCGWEEFKRIGDDMSICVGNHTEYANGVRTGKIQIWLVRDPNGENLFCIQVTFEDPELLQPKHFIQVKGRRNRFPGWSDKDFYAYAARDKIWTPLRGRATNPANVEAIGARELGRAQAVPGGEVALCRVLCESVGLEPYCQPDLLCGLYA